MKRERCAVGPPDVAHAAVVGEGRLKVNGGGVQARWSDKDVSPAADATVQQRRA